MIKLRRVYEAPSPKDGWRVLVDRLWPRGLAKEKAGIDLWLKEVAPSSELRRWFSHQPEKWEAFRRKYEMELRSKRALVRQIRKAERENGTVTLLYAARDEKRNNAAALRKFLRRTRHA